MRKAKAIPRFKEIIIKNPNTLFPVDWEKILDEGDYWYEEEPELDKSGNVVTKRNLYIVKKVLTGFYYPKKTAKCVNQRPLFELKGNDKDEEK